MPSKSGTLQELLSGQHGETLHSVGQTVRELAVTTLGTVLQTTMEIEEIEMAGTTPQEVEGVAGDPFVVAELDLQTASGEHLPSILFIGQEDLSLIFNLTAVDSEEGAGIGSPIETRLTDLLKEFTGNLNRTMAEDFGQSNTLSVTAIKAIEAGENPMPKSFNKYGDQLVRISYNVVMPNIMAAEVVHLGPIGILEAFAGAQAAGAEMVAEESQDVFEQDTEPVDEAVALDNGAELGLGLGDFGLTGENGLDLGLDDLPEEMTPPPAPARRPQPAGAARAPRPAPARPSWEDEAGAADFGQADEDYYAPMRSGPRTPGRSEGPAPVVRPTQFSPLTGENEPAVPTNIELIMDVSLRLTVELGRTQMQIREILDLGPGSVVELDKLAGEPVDILVNDRPIARGEVVVVDENFGVRVTDIITPQKRVQSLR